MKRKQIAFKQNYHCRMKNEAKAKGKLLEARAMELVDKGYKYEALEESGTLTALTDCHPNSPAGRIRQ
jgi:hypothetical protein